MYKKFKANLVANSDLRGRCDLEASAAAGEHTAEVDELWRRVEARPATLPPTEPPSEHEKWRWVTASLFISSTFKDFHAERERLVKRALPDLRDWCERRRIRLVECDLRWGVPQDSEDHETVATCLGLLDRCHAETGGRPFFLGLLGHRWGWCPTQSQLGQQLHSRYNWCDGASVTLMEITHSALSVNNPNALFLLRDSSVLSELPSSSLKHFKEPDNSLAAAQVARLRAEVTRRYNSGQALGYRPRCEGSVKAGRRTRPNIVALEEFEASVISFFKAAIQRQWPDRSEEEVDSPVEESNVTHVNFMLTSLPKALVPSPCLQLLLDFVERDLLPPASFRLFGDSPDCVPIVQPSSKSVVVAGGTGIGKTTALSSLGARLLNSPDVCLFVHFAQLTPVSNDRRSLQRKLKAFFASLMTKEEAEAVSDEAAVSDLFDQIARLRRRIVVIIDAFERFYEVSHLGELLPAVWPPNVKCILSCNTKDLERCFCQRRVHLHELVELNESQRLRLSTEYLGDFGKRLDAAQVRALMQKKQAGNPLWLTRACEELRLFDDHAGVTRLIERLPDDTKELMKIVLFRVSEALPAAGILLSLTSVARIGLWEAWVRRLLAFAMRRRQVEAVGKKEEEEEEEEVVEIPLAEYLRLRRRTSGLLRTVQHGPACVTFEHSLAQSAAKEQLVSRDAKFWHSTLADFVLSVGEEADATLARDLPFNLYWSDRRSELHRILCGEHKLRRLAMCISHVTAGQVYASWRCRFMQVAHNQQQQQQSAIVCCRFCRNRTSRHGVPRNCACIYCGMQVRNGSLAFTCHQHMVHSISFLRCWYCNGIDSAGTPLSICGHCGCLSNPNLCCYPVLETDAHSANSFRGQNKRLGLLW